MSPGIEIEVNIGVWCPLLERALGEYRNLVRSHVSSTFVWKQLLLLRFGIYIYLDSKTYSPFKQGLG